MAAAEVEGADDLAITAESSPSSEADAAADEADDLEGLAEAADETRATPRPLPPRRRPPTQRSAT